MATSSTLETESVTNIPMHPIAAPHLGVVQEGLQKAHRTRMVSSLMTQSQPVTRPAIRFFPDHLVCQFLKNCLME